MSLLGLLHRHPLPAALVGGLTIAWAGIFVRLADVSVATSATYRCAFAVPVLVAMVLLERRRARAPLEAPAVPPPDTRGRVLGAVAGGGLAGRLLLWHASIAVIGAGIATVLLSLQAVLVPLGAWLLLRDTPTRRQLIALPVVLAGVALVAGVVGGDAAYGSHPGRGALLGLGGAFGYAIYQLASKSAATHHAAQLGTLTLATAVSAVVTATWGLATHSLHVPTGAALGWLVALALVVQVVGWILLTAAMVDLSATTISLVILLQPMGGLLLAMLIFGEHPSPLQWVGIALTLAGVVMAAQRRQAVPAPAA